MSDSRAALERDLGSCFIAQEQAVADWHQREPEGSLLPEAGQESDPAALLRQLVLAQHLMNFRLWHVEDTARRKDVDASVIADCKYRIDKLNQSRNDAIESVDACLVARIAPLAAAPAGTRPRHNTESLGMAIDRLSILALKIYHMAEQTERTDVDAAHLASCRDKLAVLREQRSDLIQAVLDLVGDFIAGIKQPKAYYQFKMYNDPALNPALYGNKGGSK